MNKTSLKHFEHFPQNAHIKRLRTTAFRKISSHYTKICFAFIVHFREISNIIHNRYIFLSSQLINREHKLLKIQSFQSHYHWQQTTKFITLYPKTWQYVSACSSNLDCLLSIDTYHLFTRDLLFTLDSSIIGIIIAGLSGTFMHAHIT